MIFLKKQMASKKLHFKHFIVYVVVLILGPGLIVNLVMKPYFHRSRPRELVEFHGTKHFTPVLTQGDNSSHNPSFPSGHAAVGFMMLVPGFNSRNHSRRAMILFSLGTIWGSLVSVSRMIQGGHFFSDVFYSAAIIIGLAWSTEMILTHHFNFSEQN
jgi:lipid A 4'-phosphatase